MPSITLRIRLLGDVELRLGDAPLEPIESARAASLLAYLVLHRDAPQRRQHLAFLLWPDSREAQARTNLRHALHDLRRALPEPDRYLDVQPQTIQWRKDAPCSIDVPEYDDALARSRQPSADGGIEALREAVAIYRGDLLSAAYDEWLTGERERLRRSLVEALERLAVLLEARGNLSDAVEYAERLLRHDALREDAYRLLMRLHDARGDRARALHAYHACAAMLERELGVQPSAGTRQVYDTLLRADRSSAPAESRARGAAGWPRVGRAAEWARLTSLWLGAEGGRAQFVLVSGEAGAGKTRLVEELRAWCAQRGAAIADARAYAAEGALAYGPLVAWLRAPVFEGQLGRLDGVHRTELARLLPEIAAPNGGTPDGTGLRDGDQRRLFDAATQVLSLGGALLLVIDDLPWSDRETMRFLHYLLRMRPAARLLVAATARREETEPNHPMHELLTGLRQLERCTEIELGRLSAEETVTLAARVAGTTLNEGDARRLYEETGGNALFVVEAMRAGWQEMDARQRWISPRMQAVIESRLAQLSDPARELVGVAAAIGTAFTSHLLARATDAAELGIVHGLDELWRRGIIREQSADAYDFSHDKIRDVAYQGLSPALRRAHHLAIARALERVHAHAADDVSGQLAAHYERAGAVDDAVTWYTRAADAAQRVYADTEAVRLLERALQLARSLSASRERAERELTILSALQAPLGGLEGYASPRLTSALQAAVELARSLAVDPAPPLLRSLAMVSLTRSDFAGARRVGEQLAELGARSGDSVLTVESAYVLGIAAFWQAEFGAARGHFENAIARYEPAQAAMHLVRYGMDPRVVCLTRLANTLWFLGDSEAAVRARADGLALADELGHPYTRTVALVFAAMLALDMRDAEGLRSYAAALRAEAARQEAPQVRGASAVFDAYIDALDGNTEEGVANVRRAIGEGHGADPAPGTHVMLSHILVETCAVAADADAGLRATDDALATAGGACLWEADVRRRRAEFLAILGAPQAAIDEELSAALAVARRQGARPLAERADTVIEQFRRR